MNAADSTSWATLESRGFRHIPSFFSQLDLQALITDFESASTTVDEITTTAFSSSNNGGSCYNFKISRHSLVPQIAFVRSAF